jgi:hypothetical protein
VIVEIGGTVGDIESLPFLEAVRQFRQDVGRDNAIFVHLALVPYIAAAHELKTKPMQHSVRELRAIGIHPNILLCRTDRYLSADIKSKLSLYCDVPEEAVITAKDVDSIYEVPLVLSGEGLDAIVLKSLGLESNGRDMAAWEDLVRRIRDPQGEVVIGIVGKYVSFEDSYKSLNEALTHGGFSSDVRVVRRWVEAEELEAGNAEAKLAGVDGILVPGGFGARGTAGMAAAAQYARSNGVPYFGICYGFQWAVTEFARNVCGLTTASSTEVDPDAEHKVIYKLQDLLGVEEMGGTMRLGSYACQLKPGSRAASIYGATEIHERHRHRFEFNRAYESCLSDGGLVISGKTRTGSSSRSRRYRTTPGTSRCSSTRSSNRSRWPPPALRGFRSRQPAAPQGAGEPNGRLARAGELVVGGSHKHSALVGGKRLGGGRPLPDRGPVRHREPAPSVTGGGAAQGHHRGAGHPADLQGELRQGESLQPRVVPGPGLEKGLEILAGVRERRRCADPDRRARDGAGGESRAGRGRASDPRLSLSPDDLVLESARSGRAVNIKKGQFMAPWDMKGSSTRPPPPETGTSW